MDPVSLSDFAISQAFAAIPSETWRLGLVSASAVTVRVLLAPYRGIKQSLGGASSGLLIAFVFTDPVVQILALQDSVYRDGVAAVLALVGEQVVRRVMAEADSPTLMNVMMRFLRAKISAFPIDPRDDDRGNGDGGQK